MLIKSMKQEFKSLMINKMTIIVLFILPILTVILIGVELSAGTISDIPMAIIDYDQTTFSRQLIDSFDQNEIFTITNYPSSEEKLEILIKNSKVRVGMIIPKNFYTEISSLKSPTILMIYDGSHMSITSASKSKAMEILLTYKAGATIKQLTGRLNLSYEEAFNITQALKFNNRVLYNPSKNFNDFLAPILMAGIIQAAVILTASISINHDIYTKIRSKRIGYPSGEIFFYTLLGSLSSLNCILIQVKFFKLPFRGSILDALILSIGLCFAVTAFCVLISSLLSKKIISLIVVSALFLPNSIMAGTTWPLVSMPSFYQGFAIYMPFARYANNLRDIYLKGASLKDFSSDVIYLFAFGSIVLILTEIVMIVVERDNDDKEFKNDLSRDVKKRNSCDI